MSSGLRGQRVVVGIYLIIVAFTGVAGYMTATVVGEIDPPRLLFLIELPPTPIGMAVFGAGTIGLVLGILLVAVTVVSDRFDDAAPGRDEFTDIGYDEPTDTDRDEVTDTDRDESTEPTVDGPKPDGSDQESASDNRRSEAE